MDARAKGLRPCGEVGVRLVRKSFRVCDPPDYGGQPCLVCDDEWHGKGYGPGEAPPLARKIWSHFRLHLPDEACRLVLEITAVRVEL